MNLPRLALGLLLLGLLGAAGWWGLGREAAAPAPGVARVAEAVRASAPGEDLPPAGTRSLFDHLLAQNDGLPWPFEKLVALVAAQSPGGEPPLVLMIPHGRSLLKASADFARPRVLLAADVQAPGTPASLGLNLRGQLFLGFVEAANEIEVLSYNERAGRYEFQLVQNYCENCVPRIVYARRAICTSCHQGGAPIFPQRPWSETNGQPEIAEAIVAARGGEPYLGVPPRAALAVPERYDELTDFGAFLLAAQAAWAAVEVPTRRQMTELALRYAAEPGAFGDGGALAQDLRAVAPAGWPAAGIAVAESDLRNRDPLLEPAISGRGLRGFWYTRVRPPAQPPGAKDNEDLEAFDRLPRLPAELDPLSPRPPRRLLAPGSLDAVYGLAQLFSAEDLARLDAAAGYQRERWLAALQRVPETVWQAPALSRVDLLQALLADPALGGQTLAYCCLDTAEMSEPVASGVPPLAIAEGSVLRHYERYCFACHRGNPAARLNFMAGSDEAEVLARIRDTAKIRDALDWTRYAGTDQAGQLMPPVDSPQYALLQENPQAIEAMREAVPGLFDF